MQLQVKLVRVYKKLLLALHFLQKKLAFQSVVHIDRKFVNLFLLVTYIAK